MRIYDEGSDRSSSSSESEPDSGDDYVDSPRISSKRKRAGSGSGRGRKPPRKTKAAPKPLYIAEVKETPTNAINASEERVEKADSNVLARIRKAIELATHPGTGEAEAKTAMRMATKLMEAQNITHADLIANESAEERATRADHSKVKITSTAGIWVKNRRWYEVEADAACEAFDVQFHSVADPDDKSLDYIFYGLADNTVAAALAFEMLQNQIEVWVIEKKNELKGSTAKSSYRIGVAERVLKDAKNVKRKALKEAQKNEKKRVKEEALAAQAARAAEIARLSGPAQEKESQLQDKVDVLNDNEDIKNMMVPVSEKNQSEELAPVEKTSPVSVGQKTREGVAAETARNAEIELQTIPPKPVKAKKSRRQDLIEDVPDEECINSTVNIFLPEPDRHSYDSDADESSYPLDFGLSGFLADSGSTDVNTELRPDFEGDADHLDFDLEALEEKIKSTSKSAVSSINVPQRMELEEEKNSVKIKSEPTDGWLRMEPEEKKINPSDVQPEPTDVGVEVKPKVKSEPTDDVPSWSTALQLVTFRDNAKTIAEAYLKDAGIKLTKGSKWTEIALDTEAYIKGWDDGKKVDLKRRRIDGPSS